MGTSKKNIYASHDYVVYEMSVCMCVKQLTIDMLMNEWMNEWMNDAFI